jgi:hypothetical protein
VIPLRPGGAVWGVFERALARIGLSRKPLRAVPAFELAISQAILPGMAVSLETSNLCDNMSS